MILWVTIFAFTPCSTLGQDREGMYTEKGNRWFKYLHEIEQAKKAADSCNETVKACDCFLSQIDSDLSRFHPRISVQMMKQAREKGTHYQVIGHKLFREKDCLFPSRCEGVEHFILRVLGQLPDMEFVVNTRDYPQTTKYEPAVPVMSFSRAPPFLDILYPAWSFWAGGPAIGLYPTGIGRWDQHRESISQAAEATPWSKKIPIAFFRGSRTSHQRDPLVLLSRQKPDLLDAAYTKNQAWKSPADTLNAPPAEEVSFEEHCRYKYLFNFRGVAASFRLKHLFLCKSLVFHVGSEWVEFWYSKLVPWLHYIPVSDDLSDVEELLEFVKENDQVAQEIALRGYSFIHGHLTPETVECYWRRLLRRLSSLLAYKVTRQDGEGYVEIKAGKRS